jgi:cytochrome c peroxidase
MHARTWALAALHATLLTACSDPTAPTSSGAETEADSDAATGSTGTDEPAPTDGGEPTTADPDAGTSGDDPTDPDAGSTDTGDPGECYPPQVTDHLDLPCPADLYDPPLPAHFDTPAVQGFDNTPADNPITDAGATLGRVLFYDPQLSQNGTISCASCHQQELGFSDSAVLSEGFEGGLTGRNSMGLADARFYAAGHFFWDERAATLEDQVLMPIQDPVEMGLTLPELVARVEAQPY